MIKKLLLSALLMLTLTFCSKPLKNAQQYFYENGESSVEFKILNETNSLTYDTPIRANFEWKNIDIKTSSIYGEGIKILRTQNGITETEINIPSNILESDTLHIKLQFEIDDLKTETEFKVPIKNTE